MGLSIFCRWNGIGFERKSLEWNGDLPRHFVEPRKFVRSDHKKYLS